MPACKNALHGGFTGSVIGMERHLIRQSHCKILDPCAVAAAAAAGVLCKGNPNNIPGLCLNGICAVVGHFAAEIRFFLIAVVQRRAVFADFQKVPPGFAGRPVGKRQCRGFLKGQLNGRFRLMLSRVAGDKRFAAGLRRPWIDRIVFNGGNPIQRREERRKIRRRRRRGFNDLNRIDPGGHLFCTAVGAVVHGRPCRIADNNLKGVARRNRNGGSSFIAGVRCVIGGRFVDTHLKILVGRRRRDSHGSARLTLAKRQLILRFSRTERRFQGAAGHRKRFERFCRIVGDSADVAAEQQRVDKMYFVTVGERITTERFIGKPIVVGRHPPG